MLYLVYCPKLRNFLLPSYGTNKRCFKNHPNNNNNNNNNTQNVYNFQC